jgi:hypothetical protein
LLVGVTFEWTLLLNTEDVLVGVKVWLLLNVCAVFDVATLGLLTTVLGRAKLRFPKLWKLGVETLLTTLGVTTEAERAAKLWFANPAPPRAKKAAEALVGNARAVPPSSAAVPRARIDVRFIMEVSKGCDRDERSSVWSALTPMTFTQ